MVTLITAFLACVVLFFIFKEKPDQELGGKELPENDFKLPPTRVDLTQEQLPFRLVEPEYYKDKKGEYRWRIKAPNNKIIHGSTEGFSSKQGAQRNFKTLCQLIFLQD